MGVALARGANIDEALEKLDAHLTLCVHQFIAIPSYLTKNIEIQNLYLKLPTKSKSSLIWHTIFVK